MNTDIKLLIDRIDDLENRVIELQTEQPLTNSVLSIKKPSRIFLGIPLLILFLGLVGFNLSYSTENHQISYSNDNLLELSLGCLTVASSIYTFKKHKDEI